jgi:hypothetical protein
VISVTSHSPSNNKKEEKGTDNKMQEEKDIDQFNAKELKNQEAESTVNVSSHSPSNNKKKQEEETGYNNSRESECGKNQETDSAAVIVTSDIPRSYKKPEQETNIFTRDCEVSHENQSTVISTGSHSTSNISNNNGTKKNGKKKRNKRGF